MSLESMNEHMERLRQAALKAITEDDVRQMMANLMDRAKKGDKEAVRMMLAYLTPAPQPAPQTQVNVLRLRAGANGRPRKMIEHASADDDGDD